MEYRRLGQTGLRVSTLGLGSWVTFGAKGGQYGVDTAVALMGQAYEAGVNFFDNAETYADGEAEAVMGDALARLAWRRSSYVLTTKIFFGATYGRGEKEGSVKGPNETGLSRKHIFEGLAASLARLRVSYVDVVFAHRPDADTPLWETVRAFSDAVDRGLALYWGTSEWTRADIEKARALADKHGLHPPVCEQPEYNLMARARVEVEYGPLYGAEPGLGLTTWSPLASGVLTGKYSGGAAPPGARLTMDKWKSMLGGKLLAPDVVAAADAVKPIAAELGATPAQVAIAWCALNPNVSTVILGATSSAQLADNLGAVGVLAKLREKLDVVARLEAVFGGAPPGERRWRAA